MAVAAVGKTNTKLTAQQRAAYFAQTTRQNWQVLPAIGFTENSSISFNLPKTKLLSRIRCLIQATLTTTQAAAADLPPAFAAPFNLIRNVRVEANNGFTFFNLSGAQLYMYSLLGIGGARVEPTYTTDVLAALSRDQNVLGITSGAGGAANTLRMNLDLPITLNDRDPQGLILLQNDETIITVTIEFQDADALASAIGGYTLVLSAGSVTPLIETYAIPAVADAFPDLSILKLVGGSSQAITGAGSIEVKMPVGLTYRKLIFYIQDASGGEVDGDITGNLELIFNQADTPYRIPARTLSAINQMQYCNVLPNGMFVFDFSSMQGVPNLIGTLGIW